MSEMSVVIVETSPIADLRILIISCLVSGETFGANVAELLAEVTRLDEVAVILEYPS